MDEQRGIAWHLDPSVWQRAYWQGYQGEIWWTGPDQQVGWAVFPPGAPEAVIEAVAQGTGENEADGKAQAEAEMLARA